MTNVTWLGSASASLMRVNSSDAPVRSPARHRRVMEEVHKMVESRCFDGGLKERGLVFGVVAGD